LRSIARHASTGARHGRLEEAVVLANLDVGHQRFERGRDLADRCDIHRVPSADVDAVYVNLNDRRIARTELSPREITAEHGVSHAFRAWWPPSVNNMAVVPTSNGLSCSRKSLAQEVRRIGNPR
jgi:hypothetical protein